MTDAICSWARGGAAARRFHDEEWGRVVDDDRALLELVALGITMAGMSLTVALAFRERMRAAYAGFDPKRAAKVSDDALAELIESGAIVRNAVKARAIRADAAAIVALRRGGGSLGQLVRDASTVDAHDDAVAQLAAALKAADFAYAGPTLASFLLGAAGGRAAHDDDCAASTAH